MHPLEVTSVYGSSVMGRARFSDVHRVVEVNRSAPMIRTTEDARAMMRSSFLDPTVPVEVNLLEYDRVATALHRAQFKDIPDDRMLEPEKVIRGRPAIGVIPPETLTHPRDEAAERLATTGDVGEELARLRLENTDGAFWSTVAEEGLYPRWILELLDACNQLGIDRLVPSVPVIERDIKSSPRTQAVVNQFVHEAFADELDRHPNGMPYSLHFRYNALSEEDLVKDALRAMRRTFHETEHTFKGIHIAFAGFDSIRRVTSRTRIAKELVSRASQIGAEFNAGVWVSDVGPTTWAFLDAGASFASYGTNMTPRLIYGGGGDASKQPHILYGNTLNRWEYDLLNRKEVKQRGDDLQDTGLMESSVPSRANTAPSYRKSFGKPNNLAVMQAWNQDRLRTIREEGDPNAGHRILQRSSEPRILAWADEDW